jgi:hypothetical protein
MPRARIAGLAFLACALVATALAATTVGAGKPGYPDKIAWSNQTWQIKTSRSAVGPGPNVFAKENVSVDANGALHLKIQRNGAGTWTSSEIIGPTSFGYGTYTFTVASSLDALDPNVVLGLFTWSDRPQYAHREIDIEFARWGSPTDSTNAQYVVQPYDASNHLARFSQPAGAPTIHSFTWRAGSVSWVSRAADGSLIASYAYSGADVPKPGDERVRLNLWLFGGSPPLNGQPVEILVSSFAYTP